MKQTFIKKHTRLFNQIEYLKSTLINNNINYKYGKHNNLLKISYFIRQSRCLNDQSYSENSTSSEHSCNRRFLNKRRKTKILNDWTCKIILTWTHVY